MIEPGAACSFTATDGRTFVADGDGHVAIDGVTQDGYVLYLDATRAVVHLTLTGRFAVAVASIEA